MIMFIYTNIFTKKSSKNYKEVYLSLIFNLALFYDFIFRFTSTLYPSPYETLGVYIESNEITATNGILKQLRRWLMCAHGDDDIYVYGGATWLRPMKIQ